MDYIPPQTMCIAQAIYAEAGNQSQTGRRAVGHVIMNRTRNRLFPRTPCAVVRQRAQFVSRTGRGLNWQRSLEAAQNLGADPTGGALFFRAVWAPIRSQRYTMTVRIGGHIFYTLRR